MKILIVTQYFYPETFRVNTLARKLAEGGHDVTVLTGYPQYPQGEIYQGYGFNIPYDRDYFGVRIERVKVHPRGHDPLRMIRNCFSFVEQGNKWVKRCKEKYDIVYVFEVSPVTVGLPALKYKKKFGTPVLFNVQDLWPENVQEVLGVSNKAVIAVINKIVDKIYCESDKILCSSKGFVENIAARGVVRDKLIFWPQFCEEPAKGGEKPSCYNDDSFNIVFAGNIGNAQGLDLLIEAADELREEKVKWFLVGDGRAKERLEKLVCEKDLRQNVVFINKVSEQKANDYVRFADCAYLSFKDSKLFDLTIPAKLQTYLACKTPILAATGGESAEIITTAQCGLVTPKTKEGVAAAVREFLKMSKADLKAMSENAYSAHRSIFDPDMLIDELMAHAQSVVKKTENGEKL